MTGEVTPRSTLLAKARRARIRIGYPCRGEGICGKCAVELVEGDDLLDRPSAQERLLLERERCGVAHRMACLARVERTGELVVRVGGGTYRLSVRAR